MDNEWTKEIEALRARNAALEAALRGSREAGRRAYGWIIAHPRAALWTEAERDMLTTVSGVFPKSDESALDAAVAAAVDARVAAIRARVELERPAFPMVPGADIANEVIDRVLRRAIDATEGGAP